MSEWHGEFEPPVSDALDRYTPDARRAEDWEDVLHRARVVRSIWRRRLQGLVVAASLVVLGLATPIGGAIRQQVADFSDWLAGTPGSPVSADEQREFAEENARSWIAFPGSPELRRLARVEHDGVTYDLLGFRSGGSLCIRVRATGDARGSTTMCAPTEELRQDEVPVRVLFADWGVGRGAKKETIGFDTYTSSLAQVTAGIAADGVVAVELVDDQGRHRIRASANAFLYVAERPDVGQRVTHVRAELESGRTVGVPFSVTPWGPSGGIGGNAGEPGGPTEVERSVQGGRIGWVERREERGEPLDQSVQVRFRPEDRVDFVRVLTPDPGSSKRVAISIGESTGIGPAMETTRTLCYHVIGRGGTSSGCNSRDNVFPRSPFTFGYSLIGAGDQFATFAGIASDDVARLELYTATGNRIDIPLRDNTFLAEVSLARLPAKMVAYDAEGRVIGLAETPRDEGPARPYGKPIIELEATVPGVGTLALQAQRTREGGECWNARGRGDTAVNAGGCTPKDWSIAPIRVSTLGNPAVFVYGPVRNDIRRLELRFADGERIEITPAEHGYVLEVISERQRQNGHELVEVVGRGNAGDVVARVNFRP